MKFKITKKDLAKGVPGSPSRCPVALLLQRKLPGISVSVSRFHITVGYRVIPMPDALEHWIKRFDLTFGAGRKPKLPLIEFDLPIEQKP